MSVPIRRSSSLLFSLSALSALFVLSGCGGGGASGGGASSASTSSGSTSSGSSSSGSGSSAFSATSTTETPSLTLAESGTRGYLPISLQPASTSTLSYEAIDPTAGATFDSNPSVAVQITAPPAYADRTFVGWQQNGSTVSTSSTYSVVPDSLTGTLTAVYQPMTEPSSGFTPNFILTYNFPHWNHMPLNVYLDGTVVAGSSNETSILNGLNRWVSASGGAISYTRVTSPASADVTIGMGSTTNGLVGQTSGTWDGNNVMISAVTELNPPVLTAGEVWTQNLDTVAAHEFGHALGLLAVNDGNAGHSPDPNDTMYVTANSSIGLISARDINTVATVYANAFNGTRSAHVSSTGKYKPVGPIYHATVN